MTSCIATGSEPRQVGKLLLAHVYVRAAELGAAIERRHCLARVEEPVLVERALHRVESLELGRPELKAHVVHFLDSDAVLAGDRAPDADRELEDLAAESFGALELAGFVGVVQDQRMEVAVAGVENVSAAQPVLGFEL